MAKKRLKCPWPAFGGKSRIAPLVWARLGDVDNFCEPFANSAAVLLARPRPPRIETVNDYAADASNWWRGTHPEHGNPGAVADACCEILNDLDPYIANAWRSIKQAPEEVVEWADGPVHEACLHAIHRWLVLGEDAAAFRRRMKTDPDYFDPKRAGRWILGLCEWIGTGWCMSSELRDDGTPREKMPKPLNDCGGVIARPGGGEPPAAKGLQSKVRIGGDNKGSVGKGVHAKGDVPDAHRPQLADAYAAGRGVHAGPQGGGLPQQRPELHGVRTGDSYYGGHGIHIDSPTAGGTCAARRAWLLDWFGRLRDRLRCVRVCAGSWERVCGSESVTTRLGTTGIFFDAPYRTHLKDGSVNRTDGIYATDGNRCVVDDVIAYCLERGGHPMMRLAACCYEGEGYEVLLEHGWGCVAWKSSGGYGNRSAKGKANTRRERIYFSPHCNKDKTLFDGL